MKKLYDEINYDLCSAKLASDYSRGYNTALKKIKKYIEDNYPECVYLNLEDFGEIDDLVNELLVEKRIPLLGEVYVCKDVDGLVVEDSFYEGKFEEGKEYTITEIYDEERICMLEAISDGIFVRDLLEFFELKGKEEGNE